MATYAQNLATARDNYAAQLAELSVNKKPNYSIEGQSVSWGEYQAFLIRQINDLNAAIQMADGGFEVRSQGVA